MLAPRIETSRNMPVSKLLSVAQVSAKLQCARSTVRKLVAEGKLRASRIGNRTIRIAAADLQTYLDGRANVATPVDLPRKQGGTHDDQ